MGAKSLALARSQSPCRHLSRPGWDLSRSSINGTPVLRLSADQVLPQPSDFWEQASLVEPNANQAISLRVDTDVLGWFKRQGPRYHSRISALLRSYMTQRRGCGECRAKHGFAVVFEKPGMCVSRIDNQFLSP